jgi:hypothetical protein
MLHSKTMLLSFLFSLSTAAPSFAFDWLYGPKSSTSAHHKVEADKTVKPDQSTTHENVSSNHGACISAIRKAEIKHGLPENLLLAIGLQESGLKRDGILTVWPWTVNSHGVGRRFDNKNAAKDFVNAERKAGRNSVDVGCLQINMRWHGQAFKNLSTAFDPMANADYAARFLKGHYKETGHWMTAAGNYHSKTPAKHDRYLTGLEKNLIVANKNADRFDALTSRTQPEPITISAVTETIETQSPSVQKDSSNTFRTSFIRPGSYQRQINRLNKKQALLPSRSSNTRPIRAQKKTQSRLTGAWWTAELSKQNSSGEKRTIYSQDTIEPVLPDLIEIKAIPDG